MRWEKRYHTTQVGVDEDRAPAPLGHVVVITEQKRAKTRITSETPRCIICTIHHLALARSILAPVFIIRSFTLGTNHVPYNLLLG